MADANDTETKTPPDPDANPPADKGKEGDAGYQLRKAQQELKAATKRAEELAAKVKENEDSKLSEAEKAQRRIAELEPFKAEVESYKQTLQSVFDLEVEEIPEDARAKVGKLVPENLPLATRLSMLKNLKAEGVFAPKDKAGDASSRVTPPHVDNTRPSGAATNGAMVLTRAQIAAMNPADFAALKGRYTVRG